MYEVSVENPGVSVFAVKSEGHQIDIDTKGGGMSPSAVLLVSLGSCIGEYVNEYLEGTHIPSNGFTVSVAAEFAHEKPVSSRSIKEVIKMNVEGLDEKRKEGIVRFINNCPVHNTLKDNPEIKTVLE